MSSSENITLTPGEDGDGEGDLNSGVLTAVNSQKKTPLRAIRSIRIENSLRPEQVNRCNQAPDLADMQRNGTSSTLDSARKEKDSTLGMSDDMPK